VVVVIKAPNSPAPESFASIAEDWVAGVGNRRERQINEARGDEVSDDPT